MATCLAHLSAGDAVLMIEDGVIGARKGGGFAKSLRRQRRQLRGLRARAGSRSARREDRGSRRRRSASSVTTDSWISPRTTRASAPGSEAVTAID